MTITQQNWSAQLRRSDLNPWTRPYAIRGGRAREVMEHFSDDCRGTILDVGAGANGPVFSAHFGPRYEALDFSASYKLRDATDRAALAHVVDPARVADGLPFADGAFDTVMCLDVLEHVDDIHSFYDELFRLARSTVLISLPNNWPQFQWSLLSGRNTTHRAGYGLGSKPGVPGSRHKHFFNLEEASEFLTGRCPDGFRCARLEYRFEHGSDGLVAGMPGLAPFMRLAGKARLDDFAERFGAAGVPAWLAAKGIYLPLRVADACISGLGYGWGPKVRFYNLFCRQIWAVFQRA